MRPQLIGLLAALVLGGAGVALLPLGDRERPFDVGVEARVLSVVDGDTIKVQVGSAPPEEVRLVEIDAPESRQPFGRAATRELSAKVEGRVIRLQREGADRYGRTLGRVYVDGVDVNAAMVRVGAAWVYDAYSRDRSLDGLEAEARSERVGLWAQADAAVEPWRWRRGERTVTVAAAPRAPQGLLGSPDSGAVEVTPPATAGATYATTCGAKPTCTRLTSCAEAEFQLRRCGVKSLDRDGDGVPCESLCRPAGKRVEAVAQLR